MGSHTQETSKWRVHDDYDGVARKEVVHVHASF
jgi:hypothetical protein